MTEEELRELIADHEGDRVEFTTATKDTDKFSEAVCAFANDLPNHGKPGYLIIGIDNQGRFAGLRVSEQLLRDLGGLRDDGNIQPLPSLTVEKIATRKVMLRWSPCIHRRSPQFDTRAAFASG